MIAGHYHPAVSIWWGIVFFAVFFIGLAKSGFGSGLGLLGVPMITLALAHVPGRGAGAALGFMLPILICGDLIAVWQYRRLFSLRIVKYMLPGSVVGLIVGGVLLWWFHRLGNERVVGAVILVEIGCECIFLVSLYWWQQWRGAPTQLMREPLRGTITGAMAGTSSTLAHGAGPIVAVYLLPMKLDRQLYVGTCATYFAMLNLAKLPVFALIGAFASASPLFSLRFIPILACGAVFGFWVNRRMNDKGFLKAVYIATFCLGWYVLYDGISTLAR